MLSIKLPLTWRNLHKQHLALLTTQAEDDEDDDEDKKEEETNSSNSVQQQKRLPTISTHLLRDPFPSVAVYTDCQAFGAGCCCLQATFGCANLTEACYVYDHFVVLAPLLLALSAASPCVKGTLTAFDTRWDLMSQTWDDRRPGENYSGCSSSSSESNSTKNTDGTVETTESSSSSSSSNSSSHSTTGSSTTTDSNVEIITNDVPSKEEASDNSSSKVGFGRFYSPRRYLSEDIDTSTLHDVPCAVHTQGYQLLKDSGVPENLACHVSSLFVRDPLVVFQERIHLDESRGDLDHWHSLNSTNWTTVRLKVPERDQNLPWRVEVRCPEIQMTDFENAAMVTLLHTLFSWLLRCCRHQQQQTEATTTEPNHLMKHNKNNNLLFLLPISLVDENMRRSAQQDAITSQKFCWCAATDGGGKEYVEKTLHEILFDPKTGLVELAYQDLLQHKQELSAAGPIATIPKENMKRLQQHLELYRRRSRGELQTTAQFIRKFLQAGADPQTRRVRWTRVCELARSRRTNGLISFHQDHSIDTDLPRPDYIVS
jgi:glutamate--cysteine ligase catalytic subunit